MSILIKNMEMPKSCWLCPLSILYEKPREMLFCRITKEEVLRNKVDGNCPLVEVPTPHGRLIDADAMTEDLNFDVECDQRALDQMDFVGQERENIQFDKDCKQNYLLYLSNASTIIESEYLNEQTN